MKINNNMKRILCILLCLSMLLCTLAVMTSCGDDKDDDGDGETGKVEMVSVIRFVEDIPSGTKISEDKLEIVELPRTDVPINAITDKTKVIDKYLTVDVHKGEFAFAGKLSSSASSNTTTKEKTKNYIIATDYVKPGTDVTAVIQRLINSNPGRTIYFPDGKYILSKPLEISADSAKKVSIRLSSYAVLSASSSWKSGDAMIRLGADKAKITESTSSYIMGGVMDCAGKATAISVEGGRDMFISNVDIKNAACGIKILAGTAYTDVENVNINGTGDSSVALKIEGDGNTFVSLRLSNVGTGVEVSGRDNTFRNVFANYYGSNADSTGFYDKSKGNNYDMCTSIHFANGFRMTEQTVSVYSACHALWNNSTMTKQYGFVSDGKMNSVIRTCVVDAKFETADSAYLKAEAGGAGQILYPIVNGYAMLDDVLCYESYRQGNIEIVQ